ncbi:hypothetical protein GALMADRAFT_230723 [Galerina marginata CBS 339.88]|uniref:DUF6534 domain-containing protein n=1 Tax=Galerina marginata (strain CBS 339.88) TaxID=685588 RepID=A0A067SNA1_GALM3|nr:hypothetical protein GALMADRAFT_230723 [Galerina marginata CBS 339.88]
MSAEPIHNNELDVHRTLGALSLGALFSSVLFGIATLQVYTYYLHVPKDKSRLKGLVSWFCELAHYICVCHFVYTWTITEYGHPEALTVRPPPSISATILIGAFIGPSVQIFFADRVRVLSQGRLIIPIFCWTAAIVLVAIEIFISFQAFRCSNVSSFEIEWRWWIIASLGLSAAIDIVEAVSICFYLGRLRSQSMASTATNIQTIMIWTMETGLLKSISEVSIVIWFILMPNTFIWIALFICLARMHSNSLLVSLNSRVMLPQPTLYLSKPAEV